MPSIEGRQRRAREGAPPQEGGAEPEPSPENTTAAAAPTSPDSGLSRIVRWEKLRALKLDFFGDVKEFQDPKLQKEIVESPFPLKKSKSKDGACSSADELEGRGGDTSDFLIRALQHGILTKQQEVYLFRRMNYYKFLAAKEIERAGDKAPPSSTLDQIEGYLSKVGEIRHEITGWNLKLALKIARQKFNPALSEEEAVGLTAPWLLRAIDLFDYSLGFRFCTFGWKVITNGLSRERSNALKQSQHQMIGEQGDLDEKLPDRDERYITARDHGIIRAKLLQILSEAKLDAREMRVLFSRFELDGSGRKKTLGEIASSENLSKERIRQIERRALEKLRERSPLNPLDDLCSQ